MPATLLMDGLHIIPGFVNTYLLDTRDGLALIDTGFHRDVAKILKAITEIGREPRDVRHILITHAHIDHMGGAAALREVTGADVYAHTLDAPIIESGGPTRPLVSAPGFRNRIVVAILNRLTNRVRSCRVDHRLYDGAAMPFDDDLVTIHIPGHCAGQIAFRWQKAGGVLFVADACINRKGMVLAAAQENVAEARGSLTKISRLPFTTACFGHGPPMMKNADLRFRERWDAKAGPRQFSMDEGDVDRLGPRRVERRRFDAGDGYRYRGVPRA